jgi:hypothetical protein
MKTFPREQIPRPKACRFFTSQSIYLWLSQNIYRSRIKVCVEDADLNSSVAGVTQSLSFQKPVNLMSVIPLRAGPADNATHRCPDECFADA